jgi:choline dehydrogenase-like flavoprotein
MVQSVSASSSVDGKTVYKDYHARVFIVAAHAFESTRLLLLSRSARHPNGLGNQGDCLGKYFAAHLSVTVAAELAQKTYPERVGFSTAQSHYFYNLNRKRGGNAFVLYLRNRSVTSPFEIAKNEINKQIIWGNELKQRVEAQFGFTAAIQALVEQLPYAENQISLDNTRVDSLGLPFPKVTYSFRQTRELRTIDNARSTIREVFTVLGAQNIRLVKEGTVSSHHMGTCRMGNDPKFSVVDRDLKVHGIKNLYVVGSSVFPTFGAIGPTLTIAALALRLADNVRIEMAGSARAN